MADVEPEMDDGQGDPLASINQRIGARLVDWLLLIALSVLIFALSSERAAADVEPSFPAWAALLWIVLVFLYEVIMVAVWGQTLGKMLLGIKLVSLADGGRLSVPAAVIRMLPVLFAIVVLQRFFPIAMVFVYFSAAFMKHSRGILDRMAGSVVIQAPGRHTTML